MKRVLICTAALALAVSLSACGQVKPGYVGLKINQFGSDAGVSATPVSVGTYFTGPGTTIEEYPVYTQTYTYTNSVIEGKPVNEEFTFNDRNGLNIQADIGVSYSVNPDLAPKLYTKFRTDAAGLLSNQIRNEIRNTLLDTAASYGVEDIYGAKKQELLDKVQSQVQAYFKPYGLNVEKLFWVGSLRLPDAVTAQINQRIANEQAALAAQANVATATANAQAAIEKAKGEADANALIAKSIAANPQIVQLKAIEKWSGQLPQYMTGPVPFVNLQH